MTLTGQITPDLFSWVEPSKTRLVSAPSVREFLAGLRPDAACSGEDQRVIAVPYERLPDLETLIDKMLADLAAVALAFWPDWYSGLIPFASINESEFAFEPRLLEAMSRAGPFRVALSIPWVKASRALCRADRPPLPKEFARSIHAAQLALAIAPHDLVIVLSAIGETHPTGHLCGLARAAEWLGRMTGARILVVVSAALSASRELDGINFDPIAPPTLPAPRILAPSESRPVEIWPIIGRPHPSSPGEQLLAKRLASDAMLGGLFQFNVRVRTRFDNRYLVDLLWSEGRVVVEVDGYEHHSNRLAFSLDRRRDYELLVSGYLVLRLPHNEVVDDVEVAIEKIRDLVLFRRSKGDPP